MKNRTKRLIATEAIRFCKEEGIPEDEYHLTFAHIMRTYLSMPKKKRGRFRLEMETVNKIGQFAI